MKVRDAVQRLKKLGGTPVRTRGSHQTWLLPGGQHVTLVINHLGSDITNAVLMTIRQVCRESGLVFDR
jgi:predicted RNA binding protein YcfA (HicA-like mRNA interferase family)